MKKSIRFFWLSTLFSMQVIAGLLPSLAVSSEAQITSTRPGAVDIAKLRVIGMDALRACERCSPASGKLVLFSRWSYCGRCHVLSPYRP